MICFRQLGQIRLLEHCRQLTKGRTFFTIGDDSTPATVVFVSDDDVADAMSGLLPVADIMRTVFSQKHYHGKARRESLVKITERGQWLYDYNRLPSYIPKLTKTPVSGRLILPFHPMWQKPTSPTTRQSRHHSPQFPRISKTSTRTATLARFPAAVKNGWKPLHFRTT